MIPSSACRGQYQEHGFLSIKQKRQVIAQVQRPAAIKHICSYRMKENFLPLEMYIPFFGFVT
jgi:hypothetical protein